MIHRESNQLVVGPYAIDAGRHVRVIPYTKMFGRHTGVARHLGDPARRVVYATMETGFYELDVTTLAVSQLWTDEQRNQGRHADLPGYHGKGFYSAQGRYVYANNGEHGAKALGKPRGTLGVWRDTLVRRGEPSDACLATGYDRKHRTVFHKSGGLVSFNLQTDFVGNSAWAQVTQLTVPVGRELVYRLPEAFGAYWLRLVANDNTVATATFTYD